MKTFAKVTILGHVGKEPESRYGTSGSCMTTFVVYTNEKWKDKTSGETQERSERHNIVSFGRIAEIARDYVKKGAPIYLEGALRTRKYQDQEKKDRYITEIVLDEINLLPSGSKPAGAANGEVASAAVGAVPAGQSDGTYDDDIPF